jgi:hypothetical protein
MAPSCISDSKPRITKGGVGELRNFARRFKVIL